MFDACSSAKKIVIVNQQYEIKEELPKGICFSNSFSKGGGGVMRTRGYTMTREQKEIKLQELRELYKKEKDPVARRIIIVRANLIKRSYE